MIRRSPANLSFCDLKLLTRRQFVHFPIDGALAR
jgi:hypothetical protein